MEGSPFVSLFFPRSFIRGGGGGGEEGGMPHNIKAHIPPKNGLASGQVCVT